MQCVCWGVLLKRGKVTEIQVLGGIYGTQNTETPEKLKKISREEFGTPRPYPQKVQKKRLQNPKNYWKKLDYFFGFFSAVFGGTGSGGPKLFLGDFLKVSGGSESLGCVNGGRDPNKFYEGNFFLLQKVAGVTIRFLH